MDTENDPAPSILKDYTMPHFIILRYAAALTAGACVVTTAMAAQSNGKLPMYPHAKNMNDMPAGVIAAGVPMVLETADAVATVDTWYTGNAPKACTRSAQSGGIKYACPSGSIMIYAHGGKTQIAFVPSM